MATDYDAVASGSSGGTQPSTNPVTDYDSVASSSPKPALKGGAVGDFLMGLGQGATLGLGPYVNAGIDTARGYLGGNVSSDYATNLRVQKIAQDQAQATSPLAYGSGKVIGTVASSVAGGAGASGLVAKTGLTPVLSSAIGTTGSNITQGAVSGALNAADGHVGEGAVQGGTIGALASGVGVGLAGLSKLIGPSAAQVTVKGALAELEAAGGSSAFKGSTLSKLYPDATNLTAARAMARADLADVGTATKIATGTVGGALGGYEGYSAAKATGQGPLGQVAGALIGGVAGAAGGSKYVSPKVAGAMAAGAPVASNLGPVTNTVLNPTSQNQPVGSGLDDFMNRFKSMWQ